MAFRKLGFGVMGVPYSVVLVRMTKVVFADWMLSSVRLHLLDESIYTPTVMLPETSETYRIHCGDLGT